MTNNELKQRLISLKIFINNKYLDQYVELIINNNDTKKEKNITEQHHIIPRIYYKHTKQPLNNEADNLVNLKYCDHVLAHCLLALAFEDKYFISASIDAIYAVLNSFGIWETLEDFVKDYPNIKDILKCNHFVSDEQKKKLQEISSSCRWYNNGEQETFSRTCPEGWVPGRLKSHVKWGKKVSERSSNCHWYNNGINCTFAETCPEGWKPGRLMTDKLMASQKRNAAKSAEQCANNPNIKHHGPYIPKTKYRWYTNGSSEARFILNEQPDGWIPGRALTTKIKFKAAALNRSK